MRSINKVIIIGNLTRDPELRQTPSGQDVCTFGIATNREWVTRESEKKSSAEFHECVAWAHLAKICSDHLKKGKLVYVEGYLKTRNWESPEGVKKFKTEIVVQDMIILEKRSRSDQEETTQDEVKEEKEDKEETAEEAPEEKKEEVKEETQEPEETKEKEEEKKEESDPLPEPPEEENPIDKDLGL